MEATKNTKEEQREFDALSRTVIGCAIEVHKTLGPGLLESAYQQCLAHELRLARVDFRLEASIPVRYKEVNLDCGFRADFIVGDELILELKSVDKMSQIHEAQLLTYMRLTNCHAGLLINFNVRRLKDGIKRFVL
ncbi:MAG: GxxExxY protein [Wenzhouxiangellaceae bacterium]